jgi:Zn-dependent peptidase ImmA (M78 family)
VNRSTITVKIDPSVLKYARFCGGYWKIADAAKKVGLSTSSLTFLEKDGGEVSIVQVEKFASAYRMPRAYFFLKKRPDDAVLPEGFRMAHDAGEEAFSPKIMLAIRKARYVQSVIQELHQEKITYDFRKISLSKKSEDVERDASYLRSLLGISSERQSRWSDPEVALRNWKILIEELGIFVLQQSLPDEPLSAFCLADQEPFVVLLNSSEHANRRIFSLFHEMCHILLHQSGICTPDDLSRNSFKYKHIERFCNQFAASFLVPRDAFIRNTAVRHLRTIPFNQWDNEQVKSIAQHFRVSPEVIYRRLMTVGILEEAEYQAKRNELIKGFEEYKERKKFRDKDFNIPHYIKVLSANGRAYSHFILENLHANRISYADAADYLDTNSRHLAKIEQHA